MNLKNVFHCGVCDGHGLKYLTIGMNGEKISTHIKNNYPSNLFLTHLIKNISDDLINNINLNHTEHLINSVLKRELSITNFNLNLFTDSISEAFIKTNEDLNGLEIDYKLSGSTLCSIIIIGKTILCANVGDSRAIIGVEENKKWKSIALSIDHKPSKKEEKNRIINNNGRVEQYKGMFTVI